MAAFVCSAIRPQMLQALQLLCLLFSLAVSVNTLDDGSCALDGGLMTSSERAQALLQARTEVYRQDPNASAATDVDPPPRISSEDLPPDIRNEAVERAVVSSGEAEERGVIRREEVPKEDKDALEGLVAVTTTANPNVDKADMRLSAYWDFQECGPMGDDYHGDWCTVQEEGGMFCQQTVSVNSSVCPSGYATLRAVLGDGNFSGSVKIDGCEYGFFAQYSCMEARTNPLDWSKPWTVMHRLSRASWMYRQNSPGDRSIMDFFKSAQHFEWAMFLMTVPLLIGLHLYFFSDLPNQTGYHSTSLLVWFGIAFGYCAILNLRLGSETAIMWFTGYILELIFSVENIFVFHIIVKVFGAQRRNSERAMTAILSFQIVLQLVCHLGLARSLRAMQFLPYVLGVWLIYVGVSAGLEGEEEHVEFKELFIFRAFQYVSKGRVKEDFNVQPDYVDYDEAGHWRFTLLAPMVLCLLVADFLLEIDVTLTKIEEIPNQYVAFTSSVLATFALPELFFVARDLFHKFGLIKYGICFVLVFFGIQMLFNRLFSIPDLLSVAIILGVMLLCILLSMCFKTGKGDRSEDIPWMDSPKVSSGASRADLES